jgi:hypothetical protein
MEVAMVTMALPEAEREHPVVAWFAVAAIACAMVLITWARVEVHGTEDLEATLYEQPEAKPSTQDEPAGHRAQVDDAVSAGRWAAGFTP